jgi:hypothetical protein
VSLFVVVHACGHEVRHEITIGKPHQREWISKQYGKKKCPRCATERWQAEIGSDNALYAALAAEQGPPVLEGSERQVMWATTIRGQLLDEVAPKLAELVRAGALRGRTFDAVGEARELAERLFRERTQAAWWIEHRRG